MNARIVAIRWQSVAVVFSVIYGLVGAGFFVWTSINQTSEMLAPFGVFAPFVQFTFNLHLVRSDVLAWNFLWGAVQTFAYAVSGWLTGAVFAILFNMVIKLTGGIDAKYVRVTEIERSPW
ncbi:MAG: hypothetical protein ABR924_11410 [Terracidiphilus sp.]|jgi:hypothetical protein